MNNYIRYRLGLDESHFRWNTSRRPERRTNISGKGREKSPVVHLDDYVANTNHPHFSQSNPEIFNILKEFTNDWEPFGLFEEASSYEKPNVTTPLLHIIRQDKPEEFRNLTNNAYGYSSPLEFISPHLYKYLPEIAGDSFANRVKRYYTYATKGHNYENLPATKYHKGTIVHYSHPLIDDTLEKHGDINPLIDQIREHLRDTYENYRNNRQGSFFEHYHSLPDELLTDLVKHYSNLFNMRY